MLDNRIWLIAAILFWPFPQAMGQNSSYSELKKDIESFRGLDPSKELDLHRRIAHFLEPSLSAEAQSQRDRQSLNLALTWGDRLESRGINRSPSTLSTALQAYTWSLSLARKSQAPDLVVRSLWSRASILEFSGRLHECLQDYREAIHLGRQINDPWILAHIIYSAGLVERQTGNILDGMRHLEEAKSMFESLGHWNGFVNCLLGEASLLANLDFVDRAEEIFEEALDLAEEHSLSELAPAIVAGRAHSLRHHTSDREQCLDDLRFAIEEYRDLGDARNETSVYAQYYQTLFEFDRFEDATAALNEWSACLRRGGIPRDPPRLLLEKAILFHELEEFDEALESLEAAMASGIGEDLEFWLNAFALRATVWLEDGELRAAFEDLKDLTRVLNVFFIRNQEALGPNGTEPIRETFSMIVALAFKMALAAREDPSLDEWSATRTLYDILQYYHGHTLIGQRNHEQAAASLAKANGKIDEELGGFLRLASQSPSSFEALEKNALALEKKREELDRQFRLLELEEIRLQGGSWPASDVRNPRLVRVQNRLRTSSDQGDVALWEFVEGAGDAFAMMITPDAVEIFDLGKSAELRDMVQAAIEQLAPSLRGEPNTGQREALRELGRHLIAPLPSLRKHLFIVPSLSLQGLPLEALLIRDVEPHEPWPFLITESSVTYLHSGDELLSEPHHSPPASWKREFIGFGRPKPSSQNDDDSAEAPPSAFALRHGNWSWIDLPQSADEVLQIAREFASDHPEDQSLLDQVGKATAEHIEGKAFEIYLNAGASEENFKQSNHARVIHLACHGFVDRMVPELSHLVLSSGTEEDGRLFLHELKNLNLACELLVLSACRSSDGEPRPLDGIDGLTRAGRMAGADAVLGTLWEVRDVEAKELMIDFYRGIHHRHFAQSLAEAKRKQIRAGTPPQSWASFVLWGDSPRRMIPR